MLMCTLSVSAQCINLSWADSFQVRLSRKLLNGLLAPERTSDPAHPSGENEVWSLFHVYDTLCDVLVLSP